jgi:hypothetical protein
MSLLTKILSPQRSHKFRFCVCSRVVDCENLEQEHKGPTPNQHPFWLHFFTPNLVMKEGIIGQGAGVSGGPADAPELRLTVDIRPVSSVANWDLY